MRIVGRTIPFEIFPFGMRYRHVLTHALGIDRPGSYVQEHDA